MRGMVDDHPEIAQRVLRIMRSQPVRLNLNMRPSAPKVLNSSSAALGFQAIVNFLLDFA